MKDHNSSSNDDVQYDDQKSADVHAKWNPWRGYLRFRRKRIVTVEPVMFLYWFGFFLFTFVLGQYVFNRYGHDKYAEYANFTGPFNFCITTDKLDAIRNGTGDEVEEQASLFSMLTGVSGQLPSVFAALFYGPISDYTGRKLLIYIISTAACITGIFSVLIVHYGWSLYFLIPLYIFNALGGSLPGIITANYSYIADIASNKRLTLRFGILESTIFLGGMLSFACGGIWLRRTGCDFVPPLLLYIACNVAIILYSLIYLPESLVSSERKERMKNRLSGFKTIIRGAKIFLVKHYSRWRLWFALVAIWIFFLNAYGIGSIFTLFLLERPLQWGVGVIGIYQALSQAVHGIALVVVLPLLTVCRLPDGLITLFGVLVSIIAFILTGFVKTTWEMFASK